MHCRRAPGESYTAQAKAKVNYPKMKSTSSKGKEKEIVAENPLETTIEQEKEKEKVSTPKLAKKVQEKPIEITIEHHKQEKVVTPKVMRKPPTGPAKTAVVEPEEGEEGGGSSCSSLVMVSRPGSRQGQGSNRSSQDLEEVESPKLEKRPAADLDREEREEREREEFEALERAAMEEAMDERKVGGAEAVAAALSRGPGTLRKSCTFLCQEKSKEVEESEVPSREELLAWLEGEQLLESLEHRREVHSMVSHYFSQVLP